MAASTTEKPRNLFQRIAAVMADVDGIPKTGHNAQFNYNYIEQGRVMAELRPRMAAHGLVLVPRLLASEKTVSTTAKGGQMFSERVTLEFTLVNADDPADTLTLPWIAEGQDATDKAINKALVAAEKYCLMKLFLISDDDDPDGAGEQTRESRPAQRTETRGSAASNGAARSSGTPANGAGTEALRKEIAALLAKDQEARDALEGQDWTLSPPAKLAEMKKRLTERAEKRAAAAPADDQQIGHSRAFLRLQSAIDAAVVASDNDAIDAAANEMQGLHEQGRLSDEEYELLGDAVITARQALAVEPAGAV